MRRTFIILTCVVFYLLFALVPKQSIAMHNTDVMTPVSEILSQNNLLIDELMCERQFNSDFRLPSAVCGAPSQSVIPFCRISVCMERAGIKCGVSLGHSGYTVCVAGGYGDKPELCSHAVDYYVFSLRRLII